MRLTTNARDEVLRWSRRLQTVQPCLRITIQAGGCAGLRYDLSFDSVLQSHDTEIICDDIRVHTDPQTLPYLDNLTLDYAEDLMGGSFRFTNTGVHGLCNCGISFTGRTS
jgi:iron-sulfur cluster assembly accessory protein